MGIAWMDGTMERGESGNAINKCLAENRTHIFTLGFRSSHMAQFLRLGLPL